ncbi:MAG: GNAT family N-acetyltransferase [Bacillaceae bacterium]
MENTILIDMMHPEDWKKVREIYLEGVSTGNATFQKEAPSWEEWDNSHIQKCRMVARSKENVCGWAALSSISSTCAFLGVAEVSVYISKNEKGKGIGGKILKSLIEESERNRFWTLQAQIFPENIASIKLHKKLGFREVGRRERIGKLDGVWRDVILLERRSNKIGID